MSIYRTIKRGSSQDFESPKSALIPHGKFIRRNTRSRRDSMFQNRILALISSRQTPSSENLQKYVMKTFSCQPMEREDSPRNSFRRDPNRRIVWNWNELKFQAIINRVASHRKWSWKKYYIAPSSAFCVILPHQNHFSSSTCRTK